MLEGRDGWLFLTDDSNAVISQLTGALLLTPDKVRAWRHTIDTRVALLDAQGCLYRHYIAPDKEIVYERHLPPEIAVAETRPVDQLLTAVRARSRPDRVRYLLPEMRDASHHEDVYPRTETHWNNLGGFVAYRRILSDLREQRRLPGVEWDQVTFEPIEIVGDLGDRVEPRATSPSVEASLDTHRARLVYDNRVVNHGQVFMFDAPGSTAPSCVVFGDSFTYYMLLFMKESFSRLTYIYSATVDFDLVRRLRPDILLYIKSERHHIHVPADIGAKTVQAMAREKRATGTLRGAPAPFLKGIPTA